MGKRIVVIQGHPDPDPARLCRALAAAYARGATGAGHEVRTLDVAALDFPFVRERGPWEEGAPPPAIARAQEDVRWAEHLLIVHPLWLGAMPALLKGFFEQLFRPGFAFRYGTRGLPQKLMKGRSARIVVTMGMPAFFYSLVYRAHAVKALARNILEFVGIKPVRWTLVGMVESQDPKRNARALVRLEALGRDAA